MLGGLPVAGPVIRSLLWLAALTALFAPLAILRYRRRV
jgi:oleandomycin transport system permease protein